MAGGTHWAAPSSPLSSVAAKASEAEARGSGQGQGQGGETASVGGSEPGPRARDFGDSNGQMFAVHDRVMAVTSSGRLSPAPVSSTSANALSAITAPSSSPSSSSSSLSSSGRKTSSLRQRYESINGLQLSRHDRPPTPSGLPLASTPSPPAIAAATSSASASPAVLRDGVHRNSAPASPRATQRRRIHSNGSATPSNAVASTSKLAPSTAATRQTRSASPLPPAQPNGLPLTSLDGASLPTPRSALEAKEDEHLHVRASSFSSAILPPPPRLPYDLSYPPLSPLGVDQNGHSLALQYPEQAAQVARAAMLARATANSDFTVEAAAASASSSAGAQNGTANGGEEASSKPASRSTTVAAPSHPATRHTPHEKPKKVLPGQELEQHLVSETRGQRPMPWGLQVTLAQQAAAAVVRNGIAAQPNRTRMGTLKRNASRDARGGKLGLQSASPAPVARLMTGDEDTASEYEASPRLPLIEVHREEKEPSHPPTPSEEPSDALREGASNAEQSVDVLMTTIDADAKDTAGSSTAGVSLATLTNVADDAQPQPPVSKEQLRFAGASTPRKPSLTGTAKESPRMRHSRSSLSAAVNVADQPAAEEGDESYDAITGGRRPRAAHKKLKMIGGYYGKNAKIPATEELAAEKPAVKLEADSIGGEPSGRASRAASSATEEGQKTGHETAVLVPTTPAKKPHQPTLSFGIRNSPSKAQSSKLLIAASGDAGGASASVVDNTDGNNEYCETCHGVGHFICCDGCPRSFHFACINPPMDIDELPSMMGDAGDEWYCNACKAQRQPKTTGKAAQKKTAFGPLLRFIEEENPSIFSLPQDIRNYFKGVATANDGSYIDSTMLRPLKINKFGFVDERDPLRLKDRNGKLVLCYHCGQSALPAEKKATPQRRSSPRKSQSNDNLLASPSAEDAERAGWRKLIGCDFCSLHWHLDCLDPPLATMPSMSRKWMCPNHVDHVVPSVRVPKNVVNSTSVHDLPVPSGRSVGPGKHYRLRVVNDGQIDIIPDPMDTYFGGSVGGRSMSTNANGQDKKDESSSSRHVASVSGPAENRGRGLEKGWEEQDIPVGANVGSKTAAQTQNYKFKFRLPEKVIRLDFWSKAGLERERKLAQLVQRQEEQARSRLDLLALTADAAAAAHYGDRSTASTAIAAEEAMALVEQVFGAHAARPLFPALGVVQSTDDDADDASPASFRDADGNEWLESAIRQTFEPGVFEREAEAHAAATISSAHTLPPAKSVTWTRAMQEAKEVAEREAALESAVDQATASAMQVDVDELKQLRAIKALLDRRGARDVMQYLLEDDDARKKSGA